MADTMTKSERSALMSRIRGDNLGPERRLRSAMVARAPAWFRFAFNVKDLPGTPDVVVFCRGHLRLAVFVNGCFFHGCEKHSRVPKTNRGFWERKLGANVRRDARVKRELRLMGYKTATVWEHDVRTAPAAAKVAERLFRRVRQ